jgi:CheY-like chemotaxis protein
MNLAVNARDAMPRGGRITITSAMVKRDDIAPREREPMHDDTYVMLSIADSGIGMSAETKAHIFEPFFTTKPAGKGTGLGLATVYGIVKQSGGYIWVDSEVGRGATFRVYFPRVGTPLAAMKTVTPVEPPWRGSGTILVVEDDPSVQRLVCRVLATRGYEVIAAANGEEALHLAAAHRGTIHLLLTDVVMPRMGGRELAERATRLRPELRVLFMSGYTDDAVVRHGVVEDKVGFVHKPFTPDTIERRVRDALRPRSG